MQRHELEHILRASAAITGADQFVVIGSQAILGDSRRAGFACRCASKSTLAASGGHSSQFFAAEIA
jgi:hypothetical protein